MPYPYRHRTKRYGFMDGKREGLPPLWSARDLAVQLGVDTRSLAVMLAKDPRAPPPLVRHGEEGARENRWEYKAVMRWWHERYHT